MVVHNILDVLHVHMQTGYNWMKYSHHTQREVVQLGINSVQGMPIYSWHKHMSIVMRHNGGLPIVCPSMELTLVHCV